MNFKVFLFLVAIAVGVQNCAGCTGRTTPSWPAAISHRPASIQNPHSSKILHAQFYWTRSFSRRRWPHWHYVLRKNSRRTRPTLRRCKPNWSGWYKPHKKWCKPTRPKTTPRRTKPTLTRRKPTRPKTTPRRTTTTPRRTTTTPRRTTTTPSRPTAIPTQPMPIPSRPMPKPIQKIPVTVTVNDEIKDNGTPAENYVVTIPSSVSTLGNEENPEEGGHPKEELTAEIPVNVTGNDGIKDNGTPAENYVVTTPSLTSSITTLGTEENPEEVSYPKEELTAEIPVNVTGNDGIKDNGTSAENYVVTTPPLTSSVSGAEGNSDVHDPYLEKKLTTKIPENENVNDEKDVLTTHSDTSSVTTLGPEGNTDAHTVDDVSVSAKVQDGIKDNSSWDGYLNYHNFWTYFPDATTISK